MKLLLTLTAIFEGTVGLGLMVAPAMVVSILLNSDIASASGFLVARLCGAAILALVICCWHGRGFTHEDGLGIVTALLFYNVAATAVLVYGGFRLGLQSPLLWPAIVLHTALGLWCAALVWLSIRKRLPIGSGNN